MLFCSEEQVLVENAGQDNEKSARMGEGDPYETGYDKLGDLYRAAQKEHGRCVGYIMVDVTHGAPVVKSIRVGWVFRKKASKARAAHTMYETWVTVYTDPPKRVWTPGKYAEVGA